MPERSECGNPVDIPDRWQEEISAIESGQDGELSLHCRKILELHNRFNINRAEDIAVAMGIHPEYARELMRKIGMEM